MGLALCCTSVEPSERPTMADVLTRLERIRDVLAAGTPYETCIRPTECSSPAEEDEPSAASDVEEDIPADAPSEQQ